MILDFIQTTEATWATWVTGLVPVLVAGTSSVSSETASTVDLTTTDTFTSGTPLTGTWWVVYDAGEDENHASAITQEDYWVSPYTFTWLTGGKSYCAKPYAINNGWATYGTEVCFSTASLFGYITRLTNFRLLKVDLDTMTEDSNFSMWSGWRWAKVVGDFLYVCHTGSGTLRKISIATFTQVDSIALPVAFDASPSDDEAFLYVTGLAGLVKVDLATFTIVATIPIASDAKQVEVYGTIAYVTDSITNRIYRVDLATNTVTGNYNVSNDPSGIGLIGNNLYCWVSSWDSIIVINATTMAWITSRYIGESPIDLVVKWQYIYICDNQDPAEVHRLDSTNITWPIQRINVWAGARSIEVDGWFLYCVCDSWLYKINATTFTVDSSLAITGSPYAIWL